MTPTEIKTVLATLGAKPNKKLGQHFLVDQAALESIAEAADLSPGETVLEIGPGLGVLTERLLQAEAEVHAIEQDRLFVPYLTQRFSKQPFSLTHGDAASLHWHDVVGDRPWKLVSNLPYSITSLAIRKALWTPRPADRVVVLIQREVAERAIARSKKTSLLSLMVALASSSARIVRRVPAGAFFPPPKVESSVLLVESMPLPERKKRWGIDPEKIMELARVGFAHPRKQLASNLASFHLQKSAVAFVLVQLKLSATCRAEDLSPDQWAELAVELFKQTKS